MKMRNSRVSSMSTYLTALGLLLAFVPPTISSYLINKEQVFPEFIKWHIYIVNGLGSNQSLFTHCKSAESDVGAQNLSPGSNTTWGFKAEFFHSTLFWCYLRKDNDSAEIEVFWYDARLFDKCDWKNCIWVAQDDGIYLTDLRAYTEELHYRWGAGMK